MIVPVILAGGIGSRLWPLSRQLNPKQFVSLSSPTHGGAPSMSLFRQTLDRLQGLPELAPPLVVCNEEHRFLAAEQLRQAGLRDARIVLEPCGRNTAPALTVAALLAAAGQEQPHEGEAETVTLLVLPADHLIADTETFQAAVRQAVGHAQDGNLVTFGITPDYPETGYGYIQRGEVLAVEPATPAEAPVGYRIRRFVEKPDQATAQLYLDAKDYYWNSGMFVMRADVWLDELAQLAPEMARLCRQAYVARDQDGDFIRLDEAAFAASPADSIDYAVMEKTRRAVVVPMDAGWNDLGAWSALWNVGLQNGDECSDGNVTQGDVYCRGVSNSYVRADSRLVTVLGLDNAVVVETADAVLVADKDQVQDVKSVVEWLKQQQRPEADMHTLVYRPWGSYESLATGPGFQVKRICVKPGAALSLQMHHHRAEHWVVLSGVATVTCDERVFPLEANQSTFIPQGSRHRLQNETTEWLELIEVQTGNYLGEDDIVRFDDVYGRT